MNVLEGIEDVVPGLNNEQLDAITSTEGPILIIAGPGTGKTLVLVLRTLYLLLSEKASPSEIVLTTFTEKAAFELRDRISQIARKLGLKAQLHELRIGTIHSICDGFISKFIHYTPLKYNYVILDELTQCFFLFEHFEEIVTEPRNGKYLNRWAGKWNTIKGLVPYLNKITEELIEPKRLLKSENPFLREVAQVYLRYKRALFDSSKVDFPHLQKIFFDLLKNPELYLKIKGKIKYIMIDEYQDTNYIQEQIMLTLGSPDFNICVVGDEDQSLYRFRGATVRNILEFPKHFTNCKIIKLLTNYRSHKDIISACNKFIESVDWSNSTGRTLFRFPDKKVAPPKNRHFPEYPAIFSIWGKDGKDEAERFADMVSFLKKHKVIQDYSDVALLLSSVRLERSGDHINTLKKHNIPYFCPRAKAYFENEEIKLMLACFALIFGFYGQVLKEYEKKAYIEKGLILLKNYIGTSLSHYIQRKVEQINALKEGQSLDLTVADYFYQLLAYKPFCDFLKDENKVRNLAIFSQLLNTFQLYYHITVVTFKNREFIKFYLFASFFRFLLEGGIDEYEDPDNPIPKGYVQIMTIHQSKGLEFPVVVVGSLDKQFRTQKQVDRDLSGFYPRGVYEPEHKITEFDRTRHFYVAFSRAQKLLVLTTSTRPKAYFSPVWDGLYQWPYIKKETLKAQRFVSKPQFIPKKAFSLSSHINLYETCPRQYLFYQEYKFQPSRAGQVLFGTLVHQTIEDIHRMMLDGRLKEINHKKIEELFEENYKAQLATGLRPLAPTPKEAALKQVINYFRQNRDIMERVIETEVDVSVEKEDYIILGKIDLLLGKDGRLGILDFKTQPKPQTNDPILDRYIKQLSLYAYILKERHGKQPEQLFLYWTSEEKRKDALMEFVYDEDLVEEAGRHFDDVVKRIFAQKFDVRKPPDKNKVCKDCDFRFYCTMEGVIRFKGATI